MDALNNSFDRIAYMCLVSTTYYTYTPVHWPDDPMKSAERNTESDRGPRLPWTHSLPCAMQWSRPLFLCCDLSLGYVFFLFYSDNTGDSGLSENNKLHEVIPVFEMHDVDVCALAAHTSSCPTRSASRSLPSLQIDKR